MIPSIDFIKTNFFLSSIPSKIQQKIGIIFAIASKGQLISKATCQAVNSSKKQTNEFIHFYYYATHFRSFLEEIEDTKKNPFEIIWPLKWHNNILIILTI